MSEVIGSLAGFEARTPPPNKYAATVEAIVQQAKTLEADKELVWECGDETTASRLKANLKPSQYGLKAVAQGTTVRVWKAKEKKEVAS